MAVRISIAVQHHPSRAEIVAPLLAAMPGATLVPDPLPVGPPNPWRTYRRALEETPVRATHRLIVQDDVVACPGFVAAAQAALAAQPDRLVSFYVGGNAFEHEQAVFAACRAGLQWAELDNQRWTPVVCLAWPVAHVAPFLGWVAAQNWPEAFTADDEMVGRYCQAVGHRPLATVPSLVDHPDDVPSLTGQMKAQYGADPGRSASCWIGDCDAASIDWTLGP